MKTHFAWRPHLDRDTLFNPFVPSERQSTLGHVRLSEAYGDEVEDISETHAAPADAQPSTTPADPEAAAGDTVPGDQAE